MSECKTLDHSSKMLMKIRELQTDAFLCDLIVIIDGEQFRAHKIVIAAASEYFRSLIQYDVTPSNESVRTRSFVQQDNGTNKSRSTIELKLENVTSDTFRLVINYIYSGEITLDEDNVEDVLLASDVFVMDELKAVCCTYLGDHITPSNCLGIRALAESLGCSDIANQATKCVENHFLDVCQSEEFLQQSRDSLYDVLCLDNLNLIDQANLHTLPNISETIILKEILRWVNHDKPHRKEHLKHLLTAVRWTQIKKTSAEYKAVLENNEWKAIIGQAFDRRAQQKKKKFSTRGVVEIMVLCGGDPKHDNVFFIPLNPAIEQVMSLKDMSRPRQGHSVVVTGGLMYVIGGVSQTGYITRCERYNPLTNTWSPIAKMLNGRSGSSIAAINNKIYILGGEGMYGFTEQNEVYDIATDAWGPFPHVEMLVIRGRRYFATLKDRLYFLSESTDASPDPIFMADEEHSLEQPFQLVQCFDPVTNKWTAKSPEYVVSAESPSPGKPEDCIFVISEKHQIVYDTTTNRWDNIPIPKIAGIELDMEGLPMYQGPHNNILRASDMFCMMHKNGILQTRDPRLGEWDLVPSTSLPRHFAEVGMNNMNLVVSMEIPAEVFVKAYSKI